MISGRSDVRAEPDVDCVTVVRYTSFMARAALLAHSPSGAGWLGHHSTSSAVRASGLWNVNHVNETYDRGFLDRLENTMTRTAGATSTVVGTDPDDLTIGSRLQVDFEDD
jgi:hypothetical protein